MTRKGEQYSKVFRKAGIALGRGDVHKAMAILQEGLIAAETYGDTDVARVLQADLERYRQVAAGAALDFTATEPCHAPQAQSLRLGETQREQGA